MIDSFFLTIRQYLAFYQKFLLQQWRDINPVTYGILLISIGVFGWLLMKNGARR